MLYIDSDKLRKLRISSGQTKEAIAKAMGITSRTLYNYEQDRIKRPNEETVNKLANYYGVDVSYFVYKA